MLQYKDYVGSVEFSPQDEVFHGKLEGIRDLVTYEATTVDDLKRFFHEAVDSYLADCKRLNKEPEKPFRGVFNVRVPAALHRKAALFSAEHKRKLNSVVSEALEEYLLRAG